MAWRFNAMCSVDAFCLVCRNVRVQEHSDVDPLAVEHGTQVREQIPT